MNFLHYKYSKRDSLSAAQQFPASFLTSRWIVLFILHVKFVLFAHWSLCNLFVWWSHDHFIRQWMKHNFTHFSLSHAERKKCGGDFFSENTIPYQNEFLRMDRTSITWMAEDQQLLECIKTFQAEFLDLFLAVTVLWHFWAHAPISEHAPLLEYRRTEVNCNIYNIAAPTFQSILKMCFFGYMRSMRQKAG